MAFFRRKKTNGIALVPFVVTVVIMFCFWVLFSGRFDAFHLFLGIISSLIVAFLSSRLMFTRTFSIRFLKSWVRFVRYLPWLFQQIFIANIHLLYLTFHPRMMKQINPKVIRFDSRLKSDVSRTTLANSITLTPGTITVTTGSDGVYRVHAIDKPSADALPGTMLDKVADIYGENK